MIQAVNPNPRDEHFGLDLPSRCGTVSRPCHEVWFAGAGGGDIGLHVVATACPFHVAQIGWVYFLTNHRYSQ